VIEALRERQAEFRRQFGSDYRTDLDLVFCNPDGTALKPDSISAAASNLCRKLKLPKGASLHALRHSHGSQLLREGIELSAVSARLGHSSSHVTAKVYSHILPGRDRAAAEAWERLQSRTAPRQHVAKSGSEPTGEDLQDVTQNERLRPN